MSKIFNIQEYGAKPDGKTLCTEAIQTAVDTCNTAGGGIVLCEGGEYLSGSIELKSNVELHLGIGCKILGSTDLSDLKDLKSEGFINEASPEGTCKYLFGAQHAENIAITGPGKIDAQGVSFYDQTKVKKSGKFAEKPADRPRIIMFHKCENVRLTESSLLNSPCWTIWLMQCERVQINKIKIEGDQRMINNDGIDIDACKDVTVSDCFIKTDDDCLILRAIQRVYDTPAVCENVVVNNCVLESTCQCIRVCCPSDHIVRNCTFNNLVFTKSRNGINFDFPSRYLSPDSPGGVDVSNISFSNIVMDTKAHPVRIEIQEGIKLTQVKGITFSDIRAKSNYPIVVKGNSQTKIEDVSFNNIQLETFGESAIDCSNCTGIKFNNVEVSNINE